MATPVFSRVSSLRDVTGTPSTSRQFRYARGAWQALPAMWVDVTDFAPEGVSITGKSNATETTQAVLDAISEATSVGAAVCFPDGDYLINAASVTIGVQMKLFGMGEERSRLYVNGAGALIKHDPALSSSTGKGLTVQDLGFYSERAITAAGDIGLHLTDGGANSSVAFHYVERCVFTGFHDNVVLENAYFSHVRGCYIGEYRRYGVRVTNTYTVDSGDHVIEGNWIQPTQTTSGNGYDSAGANICVNQGPGTRIVANKILPGHAIGVHIHPNATFTTESFPMGMLVIGPANQFDSFGASKYAVVIEGIYGTGVTGETEHGNKLANIQIVGNNLSNVGYLVDIRSESCSSISIIGNHAIGGGGIRTTATSVTNGLFIAANYFDNRNHGSTVGATGSGYGPTKPVEDLGTTTNDKAAGNHWVGFAGTEDIADTGGAATDTKPDLRTLTVSGGAVTVVSHDADETEAIQEVTVTGTIAVTFPALSHGDRGRLYIKHSGASAVLSFASAPSGYTLATSGSFATAADNLLECVEYECVWTSSPEKKIIRAVVTSLGTVADLTTEGGGGYLIEDTFTGSNGTISGRTPDTTNTPGNNWVVQRGTAAISSNKVVTAASDFSEATIDAEDADVTVELDVAIVATATTADGIIVNFVDTANYWFFAPYLANGEFRLYEVNGGSFTLRDFGGGAPASGNTYVLKVVTAGDAITAYVDGVEVCSYTGSPRAFKTATIHGMRGYGGTGTVTLDHFRVTA